MKEIQSLQNNIIKETIKLKEKKYRQMTNTFLIEGYHLVNEAYQHGVLKAIFTTNPKDEKYQIKETYLVNDAIIKKMSSTVNPQGIIGIVNNIKFKNIDLNKENLKIVFLDGINDPGNLGSIVRTSAALGYDAIYISNDSVDMYNEKTLRATQGAIFKIPFYYVDLEKQIIQFKSNNIKCLGTTLDASISIDEVKSLSKYAIGFGNEARGMSEKIKQLMDQNVIIPMENNVESLNVLSASSIILYELKKRVTK